MINKKITLSCLGLIMMITAVAQNNTNSPYTRFGYGKLVDAGFSRANAMGGIGFGFRQKNSINALNPAAYSAIDSTSFLFELGFSGLLSNFSSQSNASITKFTGNIDCFALQFPINKWIGVSAGIMPYSFVGYNFGTKNTTLIPSNNDTVYRTDQQDFIGRGGISQAYLGISFDLFKRLSLGVNGYYMFGTINNTRVSHQSFSDKRPTYQIYSTSELKVNSFNARFGLQYHQPLRNKKDVITIGAIYEFNHKLNSKYIIETQGIDTIIDTLKNVFELPSTYGLGLTYLLDNRFLFGFDAMYQQFRTAKFADKTDVLNDRFKLSGGVEFVNRANGNRYIDRMAWRMGGSYSNSYTKIGNNKINDYCLTLGFGFPFKTIKSTLNINFEYGSLGKTQNNLIRENYFRVGLNFTLNENWFLKRKIK